MSFTPVPLQAIVGGISLALPVFHLLILSGKVFGISGFLHRSWKPGPGGRRSLEDLLAVAGLLVGGFGIGVLEKYGEKGVTLLPSGSLSTSVLAGLLSGAGSKVRGYRHLASDNSDHGRSFKMDAPAATWSVVSRVSRPGRFA